MSRKLKIDMSGVESYVKCEEGEHVVVLKEIEEKPSSTGNEMLSMKFEVVSGSSAGAVLYDNFVLTEKSLWKLKGYLEIIGLKSEGRIVIDLDKMEGKRCIVKVSHETYNGAEKARIDEYKKLAAKIKEAEEDDDDYEEEEEEATPPPKKKKRPAPEPVEDDEDDEEEAPPVKKKKAAPPAKKKPVPVEDEDEDDEDEDDEPAPPVKKKKAAATPPAKKKKAPPVDEDDDDDWEDD